MRKLFIVLFSPLFVMSWLAITASSFPTNDTTSSSAFVGWLDDEHFLMARADGLLTIDALSGTERTFAGFETVGAGQGTLSVDACEELEARASSVLASLRQGTNESDIAFAFPGPGPFQQVNQRAIGKDLSQASPDGKWTALCRKNDMYLVDKATNKEIQLTKDGSDLIFNGRADAVYQEEIFFPGRSMNAFWWSPDSKHLAFFRLDDTDVPKFTIINHTERLQKPEITTYPKAGQPNPIIKFGIAHVADGSVTWADLGKYDPKDLLMCRTVGWVPGGKEVYFYAQNRNQTWLDLCFCDVDSGNVKVLFRDQTKAWIRDNGVIGAIKFQKDDTFLWNSERSGFKKVYQYTMDGTLKGSPTQGNWNVQQVHHVDETGGWLYFSADKDNEFGSNIYRVKLDGTGLENLNQEARSSGGTHVAHFSPTGKYFADEWSDWQTPVQASLHQSNGRRIRNLMQPVAVQEAKQDKQPKGGFFKIKTPDEGVSLSAIVQFPPNVDPAKKYPVWLSLYGGPHMPQVSDGGGKGGGGDPKTAQGYITFRMDPRAPAPRLICLGPVTSNSESRS